jgi:glycosyltransferase involved in cell wall biosynthesis
MLPMPTVRSSRRRGVVIAWMPVSQRSSTIAERLGYDLVLIDRSGFRRAWTAPLVYPVSAIRTILALLRLRPRAAIIAVPPFVAPLVALPFLIVLRARLAVDVHSGAVLDRRWRWALGILGWVGRRSVAAIVTLPSLEAPFRTRGVTTMVIPDPLPNLTVPASAAPSGAVADGRPLVVAVCGWGLDEPIEALIGSATDRPWRLVLTGRVRRELSPPPPNVTLAGFLDDQAYVQLVARADAVVVLTERDDTLLSGAWEAIALERPLVLSGTAALRTTFGDGIVYVDADPASIAAGIDAVLADPGAAASVARLRARFARENDEALTALATRLGPERS